MSSACECHIEGAWCFYCEMYVPMEKAYEAEKKRADIAEIAYQGLAESAVTRGEYESLLDKHTTMTKACWAEKGRVEQLLTLVEQQGKEMNRLQDLLRRKVRNEQKLKESMEHCIEQYPLWDSKEIACIMMVDFMKNVLSILYPMEVQA